MLDHFHQQCALEEIGIMCSAMRESFAMVCEELRRPCVVHKAVAVTIEGNSWVAFAETLSNAYRTVEGFGATPEEAMRNFDIMWYTGAQPANDASDGQNTTPVDSPR